jgi:enoyl-[acyl-carrier protein] reductase/trans-2-enoyl-CoA reductase (NAD+)
MIIKPSIRQNFFTNSHPLGCEQNIVNQIEETKQLGTFEGPKNVLIIGGSSGYGLASRIALAFGANANTINVSFESTPRGKRTGSAGYWNNIFFQKHTEKLDTIHKDFLGDAFSSETKSLVADYIKEQGIKIDLIVYSLASGVRKNEATGETVRSQIRPLDEAVTGKTIDISKNEITEITIQPGDDVAIEDTVFVMGGGDWQDWVNYLDNKALLGKGIKTIAYTYIGSETTKDIYRGGTLGKAKEDLELKAQEMNDLLSETYNGEALVSSSKGIVSKASVFIPSMPIYVSCLFEVMTKKGTHETTLAHKHRLFKDMIYGDKRILDDNNRIRLDHLEMEEDTQNEVSKLMETIKDDTIFELNGTKMFLDEFYQINGFNYDIIDYEEEVDLEALSEIKLK